MIVSGRSFKHARILIVDDQAPNVLLLERILARAGYANVKSTTDAREVFDLSIEFDPDLLLLDLHMPHRDGISIIEQIQARPPTGSMLPILVLTADTTAQARDKALSMGAKDFITKPFNPVEVLLRIEIWIAMRFLHLQLQEQNGLLEQKVRVRTSELEKAQLETLERLALAAEYRDDDTGRHTARVGQTAALLARSLALPAADVDLIRRAAPLHDVGKIGIPDGILLKPGKLTAQEFERIKTHTTIGSKLLSGGGFEILRLAEEIALSHHERWDGTGYPRGICAEEIPLSGRIVSVADVFDALTHERPYKKAWPVGDAAAEIGSQGGRQFDPRVVEAFVALETEVLLGENLPSVLDVGR